MIRRVCLLLCLLPILHACKKEIEIPPGALSEQVVDLSGTWKVRKGIRNGEDLTEVFDFSGLRLTLNMSESGPSTFEVENNGVPFTLNTNGTWSYNDLAYPTSITFSDGSTERVAGFELPPVSTGNEFVISFPLGCESNTYIYEFIRE